ncbi:hypothetical protein [Streptomyces mirabilis]|uniref:hypothetical protein n=1 Tax=Streptomyces mirabilis TaxID=68239 RepID=UPI0036CECB91
MLPVGSLENLLSAITRHGGAGHARRNAAQAAAVARAERRERDEVTAWLDKRDLPRAPHA